MLDALGVWMSHQRDRTALGLARDDEFDQLARDLGLNAAELRDLTSAISDPIQLPEMLRALDIDESSLRRTRPALLGALQRRCTECAVVARCRYSLDQHVAADDYEQYCPNAAALTAFRPIHEGGFF